MSVIRPFAKVGSNSQASQAHSRIDRVLGFARHLDIPQEWNGHQGKRKVEKNVICRESIADVLHDLVGQAGPWFENKLVPVMRDGRALKYVNEKDKGVPDNHGRAKNPQEVAVEGLGGKAIEHGGDAQLHKRCAHNVPPAAHVHILSRLDLTIYVEVDPTLNTKTSVSMGR